MLYNLAAIGGKAALAIGISVGVVLLLALAALGFMLYAYRIAFYSSPKRHGGDRDMLQGEQYAPYKPEMDALIRELEAIPYEEVETTSFDGLRLSGKYYFVKEGAPLQILFSGYRGDAVRDMCGGSMLARMAGHNAIIVDQRAHGKSGGTTICFGVKEKYDALSWVNYAIERFGKEVRIVLSGVSMGAATVLEATGLELPENVKGVIADCPFSSAEEIIRKTCLDRGFPPKLAYPFVKAGARLFGNLKIEGGAAEAVKKSKVPVMIFHGEDDRFVPCEMSRKIYQSCASEKYLLTIPNAAHGISFLVDKELYLKHLNEFIERIL